jgi:DNA adenine methylase Dam
MTAIAAKILSGEVEAPDVLVGGTPCQAFSIAGLRQGLKDDRGLLTLKFVELADAIDTVRSSKGLSPVIIVWENVPGVLSSHDNAFGNFTAALVGEAEPFEPGERPAKGKSSQFWTWNAKANKHVSKWSKHGAVAGRQRRLAWATKDAQYFGVAQRRRRCFVIASARNDLYPSQILFEPDRVFRDTPPSRSKGQEPPTNAGSSVANGSHWDNPANPHPTLNQSHNTGGIGASNQEIFCQRGAGIVLPIQCYGLDEEQNGACDLFGTLKARENGGGFEGAVAIFKQKAFRMQAFGQYEDDETASTIKCRDYKDATDLAVTFTAPAIVQFNRDNTSSTLTKLAGQGNGETQNRAFVLSDMSVRRLTPVECERLQGMPDGHTLIPAGKRKKLLPDQIEYLRVYAPTLTDEELQMLVADGHRYKAIGNSMAVPVMRWLMKGILSQLDVVNEAGQVIEEVEPVRSIFKWAGGKFDVLPTILPRLPQGKRLIEPFVGGGSVFTNAGFSENLLNDANADLINVYQMLARAGHRFITLAHSFFSKGNNEITFNKVKARFNAGKYTSLERAAAFLYLNRHGYNGLTRYNLSGEFNVGFGRYKKPYFPLAEMEAFLGKAHGCEFMSGDFSTVINFAGEDDVVFCDPPYEPLPGTDGFTRYSGQPFTFDDHVRLVESLVDAHSRGAKIVITNSSAPNIQELYSHNGFTIHQYEAKRSISCKGNGRVKAIDLLAIL